jgi:hypothetical protein
VAEVVTQRRARLRPSDTAGAPLSAAEIARRALADMAEDELASWRSSLKEKA